MNVKDEDCVVAAVRSKDLATLRRLLEAGSNPTELEYASDMNWSALHIACVFGLIAQAQLLLEFGADPNSQARARSEPAFNCHNGYAAWQEASSWEGMTPLDFVNRDNCTLSQQKKSELRQLFKNSAAI